MDGAHDDEEALRKAIEASQADGERTPRDDEAEFRRALEESQKAHEEQLAQSKSMQSDEEKVLEFVKQQSLVEERLRKGKNGGGSGEGGGGDEDDEELRKAIERSMQEWKDVTREDGEKDDAVHATGSGSGSGSGHGNDNGNGKTDESSEKVDEDKGKGKGVEGRVELP